MSRLISKKSFQILLALMLAAVCLMTRVRIDRLEEARFVPDPDCPLCKEDPFVLAPLYIPTGNVIPYITLGYDQLLANVFWLKASLYFGEKYLSDKKYIYLYHLLDLVTDLDPRFLVPYIFGGVVLPLEANAVDEGIQLLEKGLAYIPDDWRIWFHLGFKLLVFSGRLRNSGSLHRTSGRAAGSSAVFVPVLQHPFT